jgi:multicomponent Na+:H+ antiporter subunit B
MAGVVDIVLLVFLAVVGIGIVRLHNLFAVVMLSGIYSLVMAGVFVLLDAVDVAFTEAAVGAGISTVLMLGTLSLTKSRERIPVRVSIVPLLIVAATGAALIYGTADLPAFGDPDAPANRHVVPRYLNESEVEIGIPNVVTSVLASYRGYDTLGEVTVIFTAGIGIMLLLAGGVKRARGGRERQRRNRARYGIVRPPRGRDMNQHLILRVVAKMLIPGILLFALYVQFHGDYGPGGGFQAGVIFAAGVILYGLVFGIENLRKFAPPAVVTFFIGLGLLIFAGVGVASMIMGGNYLDYGVFGHDFAEGQHLGILLVELGVGITVAAVMIMIFFLFADRAER